MAEQYFHFLVLVFTQAFLITSGASSTNESDHLSLLAFRNQITNANRTVLVTNWTADTSFCNWIGITCDPLRQRVMAINLVNMNLQGLIPPSIANLSFLVELSLGNNSFHGSLPYDLGNLRSLQIIDLHNNQLQGSIPESIWNAPELRILNLSRNSISGSIHSSAANISRLERLSLDGNNLNGKIPEEIGNMSQLLELDLSENKFTGSVSPSIFNISSLRKLYIRNNSLSGSLMFNKNDGFSNLEYIDLSDNHLTGEIPSTLCQFVKLRFLYLSNNNLTGQLPRNFGCLVRLEKFYVTDNRITGTIPPSVGNISTLQFLGCVNNHIGGNIPKELGNLPNLQMLGFDYDNVTGEIPEAIYNISSLVYIAFTENSLSGHIPATAGLQLPNLEGIYLADNLLEGGIPLSILNATKLRELELSYNFFTGMVPTHLGSLRELQWLNLAGNQLTIERGKTELGFLSSLVECRMLQFIVLGNNPLRGTLPDSIGNLSSSIEMFNMENGHINGHVPKGVGNMSSMISLILNGNNLMGSIPQEVGQLKKLQRLYLSKNKLQGQIPEEVCELSDLGEIILSENQLSKMIPYCIGNLSRLQKLQLDSNGLTSSLPPTLWEMKNLILLNAAQNSLQGELPPDIGKLESLDGLNLSSNKFFGIIPDTVCNLRSLRYLSLSNNSFQGSIPSSLGNLLSLEILDLSSNFLTGTIPRSLQNVQYLREINLSHNHLEGEVPSGGVFANASYQSFLGNSDLCGMPRLQIPVCSRNTSVHRSRSKYLVIKIVIPVTALMIVTAVLVPLWITRRQKRAKSMNREDLSEIMTHQRISYHELQQATDDFSASNLLGAGSSGSVYKGVLSDGNVVAIKVLHLQDKESCERFNAECEVMRQIRHRNLVKVISACSTDTLKAIILPYMPNGSLDLWLHGRQEYHLDLLQRINIILDVAMALEYLHHGYDQHVIHRDLKPTNILLDEDMVAHVSDFGISKIIAQNGSLTLTKTLGTIGYIAPEYGLEGMISTSGDVYSFGIVLLESFTGKRPTEEMFTENLSLRQWVIASFPTALIDITDTSLVQGKDKLSLEEEVCICSALELALDCSRETAEERPNMDEVVIRLTKIKDRFLEKKAL
ncbi:hypothetical protein ACH5RR_003813 [Cinchona calisaya]|uniref:non-specific serine/threonine protein kinase n=1 Tax=Cinchona calisaya TaxID=153742 RepID=A0ABD3AVV6_9GENT